jgi:anti-sigma factor RsiW
MLNCQEVHQLLTSYVDQEVAPAERQAVEAHLAQCGPCAHRAKAETAARKVLAVRGASLVPRAPQALQARCRAFASGSRRPARSRRWLGLPAWAAAPAAVLLVLVGILGYGAVSGSSAVLAAEMALDHLKCFGFFETHSHEPNAQALEGRLLEDYGWKLGVPPGHEPVGLRLIGGRRCLSTDGTVAHLMYRHNDRPISLFVVSRTHGPAVLSLLGQATRVWSRGDVTYVLVASESPTEAAPVAAYFEEALD